MFVSGIVVHHLPADGDAVVRALDAIEGVEVHHRDPERGRLVATIEAESVRAETQLFRRVLETPGVLDAALVVHRLDPDAPPPPPPEVPGFLAD